VKWSLSLRSDGDAPLDELAANLFAQASIADGLGFDELFIGDKPGDAHGRLSPLVSLAAILDVWRERPVGALLVVPPRNPRLLAEELATLAALARRPVSCAVALGTRLELERTGQPDRTPLGALEAHLEELWRLLPPPALGKARRASGLLPAATASPVSWVGAANADQAIRRVARSMDGWVCSSKASGSIASSRLQIYLTERAKLDLPKGRTMVRRNFVARASERDGAQYPTPELLADEVRTFADAAFDEVLFRTSASGFDAVREDLEFIAQARELYESNL
jgi:alkanesulfonate monooxygenase SsuD/methylene tetrahydromethanopterin reductase-like flavin-dependent oxidoreductase (luciferase family)